MLSITTNFDISARLTPQRSILLKEKKMIRNQGGLDQTYGKKR